MPKGGFAEQKLYILGNILYILIWNIKRGVNMGRKIVDVVADLLDQRNVEANVGEAILDFIGRALDNEGLNTELKYETDNRDEHETWLSVEFKGVPVGHIRLSVKDMFGLIMNVMENSEGMDSSEIENGIEELTHRVYGGIPRKEEGGASPAQDMVDRGAVDT
jgi:hypothetical protein